MTTRASLSLTSPRHATPRGAKTARGRINQLSPRSTGPRTRKIEPGRQGTISGGGLGQNFLAKSEWNPLQALRPDATRPTVLELGPRETAAGSDLVRRDPASLMEGAPTPAARPPPAEQEPKSELQMIRRQVSAQQVATSRKSIDGHAEAVISVMRDFFQTRPNSVLLEVFRGQDGDSSGEIDLDEFKVGLRKLNLDLSDRDMAAVFHAADADGSGEVDIDEFFNCFRTDSFPREDFFWSKTRPRGLLDRDARIKLAQTLGGAGLHHHYTAQDVLNVVQRKVDQFNVKNVYNTLDENRSGRISVREFVGALREMEIMIPDSKAEEIIVEINSKVGDPRRSHLSYRSFCNYFAPGVHEGTTGSDEGVVGAVPKALLWRKHVRPSDLPQDANARPVARSSPRGGADGEEHDTIQRFAQTRPSKDALLSLSTNRGKLYEQMIEAKAALMERHDMMAGWRDGTVDHGKDQVGAQSLGRDVDWFGFRQKNKDHLGRGHDPAESSPGGLPGGVLPTSTQRAETLTAGASAKLPTQREASSPGEDEAVLATTVRGCLLPIEDSPAYASEAVRLTPRPMMWSSPESSALKERKAAKQEAARVRRAQRDARLFETQAAEAERTAQLETSRFAAHQEFAQRTMDWQQVIESRIAEAGLRTVVMEPPGSSHPAWAPAPPHRTSHWETIGSRNLDPPSRAHVKPIVSYRRAFPEVDQRPPTPRKPVWGGDRASLSTRPRAASPR
jgi:Ca2+-binding EF-hand superfamily protein